MKNKASDAHELPPVSVYQSHQPESFDLEDSRTFVAGLLEFAKNHRVIEHPLLLKIRDGGFKRQHLVLTDFLYQYSAYSSDFLRYLTGTISQLESRKHREALMRNVVEELGHLDSAEEKELKEAEIDPEWVRGVPHPQLYSRFMEAIGCTSDWKANHPICDEVVAWKAMFNAACSAGGASQAVGAMGIATESIVKYIYRKILGGIHKTYAISPEERVFFDLHAAIDDKHGDTLNEVAAELAQYRNHRVGLHLGVVIGLNLRASFLDAMLIRAENIDRGTIKIETPLAKNQRKQIAAKAA